MNDHASTQDSLVRKLPFSLIAEQSLLGAILVDPESFNEIADVVAVSDFYLEEHQQIFSAMHELFLTSRDIDVVTLIDMLDATLQCLTLLLKTVIHYLII